MDDSDNTLTDNRPRGGLASPGGNRASPLWQPPTSEGLQGPIAPHKIVGMVGRGGMAAVYKGWQVSLERYVAIKILPPNRDNDEAQFAERFKREAKTMAK